MVPGPRFGIRPRMPPPRMPPGMPPGMPPMFNPMMRQRLPPPPLGGMPRPRGPPPPCPPGMLPLRPPGPPPMFGPGTMRGPCPPPMMGPRPLPMPMMPPGPRTWMPRIPGVPPPMMRPRFPMNNSFKLKANNIKKGNKLEGGTEGADENEGECEAAREDPEIIANYCEICDRDFPSNERFKEHLLTHEICGVDGCTFTAHPKLIEKHYVMQHATGLYQKMGNLSTPEDIKQWIEERKKRFPTVANIEARKAEEREKKQRGEIIGEKTKFRDRNSRQVQRKEGKRRNRKRPRPGQVAPKVPDFLYKGIRSFSGTGNLSVNVEEENEAVVEVETNDAVVEIPESFHISEDEQELKNAPANLLSLVADYDSNSDNDEAPEEVPFKKIKSGGTQEQETKELFAENAKEIVKAVQIKKEKAVKRSNPGGNAVQKKNQETPGTTQRKTQNTKSLQLLQKLLSREIQHERNAIFQCIKFIADNNFFD